MMVSDSPFHRPQVHGFADHFVIVRYFAGVNCVEERPCVLVALQQKHLSGFTFITEKSRYI